MMSCLYILILIVEIVSISRRRTLVKNGRPCHINGVYAREDDDNGGEEVDNGGDDNAVDEDEMNGCAGACIGNSSFSFACMIWTW